MDGVPGVVRALSVALIEREEDDTMAATKLFWVVFYDIRDPKRWRQVYKLMRGRGRRIQYSVFRCRLSHREMEHLRWELEKQMAEEDSLLFMGLCSGCVDRVVARNPPGEFLDEGETPGFKIL